MSASAESTLSFSGKPVLEKPVSGWLLVNPVVEEGDPDDRDALCRFEEGNAAGQGLQTL